MTSPSWPSDWRTRASRAALRAAGILVPPWARDDWRSEWEAELWQLRNEGIGGGTLLVFLAGAFWHGAWEWKEGWGMGSFSQDVKFSLRTLGRSPGFAAAAVLILALSIGASTAFFSVIQKAVLDEPPFPDPDRIVVVDMLIAGPDTEPQPSEWSYPRFDALRGEVRSIERLAGYQLRTMTLSEHDDPEVVPVEVVSPSIFPLLGVSPARGRVFGPEEEDRGAAEMVALVSHSLWQRRFGGADDLVGRTLTLEGLSVRVVGILPPGFEGATGRAELWVPFASLREIQEPSLLEDPWNQYFHVMGRLSEGATVEMASAEAQAFGATIMDRFPPPVAASRLRASADVVTLREARQNPGARASMLALFGAVLLFLLIAVANLAGLLLARGTVRQQEAAIRVSLGAGRSRLLRQILTESLVLAVLGGALGVGLAWLGVDTLGGWLAEALGTAGGRGLEYFDPSSVAVDLRVLAFAVLLTGGVGVACGILPAWQAARCDPSESLKGARVVGRGAGRFHGFGGRDLLIGGQVAVALVLLTGASLMIRSLVNLQGVDPGYDTDRLLTAMYALSPADEQAGLEPGILHVDVLEEIRALPGVTGATLGEVPLGGPTWRTIVMGSEGRPELTPQEHLWVRIQPVADGHMGVLGVEIVEGRDIERTDDWDTERVAVLNRAAADALFPDGNPIGQRFRLGWSGYGGAGATVVGVVEGLQLDPPGEPPERQVFLSIRQAPQLQTGLLIRAAGDPSDLVPTVRSVLAELAPSVPLTSVMTMEARSVTATARPRVVTVLTTLFGALSLLLVAAGLYGSIAYAVARRTRELGLRASLGANQLALLGLVVGHGVTVTAGGIALGILGSIGAARFVQGLLFGVQSMDLAALAGSAATLVVVALVAAYLPGRRAMRVDPMEALRTD